MKNIRWLYSFQKVLRCLRLKSFNRHLNAFTVNLSSFSLGYRFVYGAVIYFLCRNSTFAFRGIESLTPSWLWPVFWLPEPQLAGSLLWGLRWIAIGLQVGAVLWPRRSWLRVGAFLSFFFLLAAVNSFGKINHSKHALLFVLFAFCFLPANWAIQRGRVQLRLVLWMAQLSFLGTYSLAGLWKVRAIIDDLMRFGSLPDYLATHISFSILQTYSTQMPIIPLDLPYVVSLFLWLSLVFTETVAAAVAFIPAAQRYFGLALVGLHSGIYLTTNILFFPPMILAIALLVLHPYRKRQDRC